MIDNKYLAHLVHYIENLTRLTQYYYINFQEFNIWSNELEFLCILHISLRVNAVCFT